MNLVIQIFCQILLLQTSGTQKDPNVILYADLCESVSVSYSNLSKFKERLQKANFKNKNEIIADSCSFILKKALDDALYIEANPNFGLSLEKFKPSSRWSEFRKKSFDERIKIIEEVKLWRNLIRLHVPKFGFLDFIINSDICAFLSSVYRDYPFEERPVRCIFNEIESIEKEFGGSDWSRNLFFRKMLSYSKISICGNCEKCRIKMSPLIAEYEAATAGLPLNNADKIRVVLFKLEDLHFKNKHKECVQFFKNSIFFDYLDNANERDGGILFTLIRGYSIVAKSYSLIGNKDLGITYQELAYSLGFIASAGEGGYGDHESLRLIAEDLRKMYLESKQFNLIRNLEGRSAKFGMKPLPKQPGE